MGADSKYCIVTLVEHKSGYVMTGKVNDRTTCSPNQRYIQLLEREPATFKTITAYNGTEFHLYPEIEEVTGVRFYSATPHHSWERGTNENTNGLIRQYLPKGTSMKSTDAGSVRSHCRQAEPSTSQTP